MHVAIIICHVVIYWLAIYTYRRVKIRTDNTGDWVGNEMPDSQGAKWVYLTWDAVKGCLVTFCSVASTYQILTAQPENYAAGKKL